MKFTSFLAALLTLAAVAPGVAFGWDDMGHEVVGEIAERHLTPKGKAWVYEVLGGEPLAIAAIFPDKVRDDVRYSKDGEKTGWDFAPYHFYEIPYGKKAEQMAPRDRAKKDAEVIISDGYDQLGRVATTREQKAILLRYFVHVVGDVHQPLHVGNGRDRGANWCYVKYEHAEDIVQKLKAALPASGRGNGSSAQGSRPYFTKVNLHSLWDGNVFEYVKNDWIASEFAKLKTVEEKRKYYPGYFKYINVADLIEEEFKGQIGEIQKAAKAPVTAWYNESQALHQLVYPGEEAKLKDPSERAYCDLVDKSKEGGKDKRVTPSTPLPELNRAYMERAKQIVKRRLLLGGYRLANQINELAERGNPKADPGAALALVRSVGLLNPDGHDDGKGHAQSDARQVPQDHE